ncbi:hypothetical protein FACS189494_01560 [Spirochaetia bacterium]|nr:hypothetical protein FACS189494_01560 [Spirochaetia bacterium]
MQTRFYSILFAAIAAFTLSGCDLETGPVEKFDNYLQGSWVSTRSPSFWETEENRGRLVIGYNYITINGSVRPFDTGYTKNIALKGYSQESSSVSNEKRGTLFVSDKAVLKNVVFVRWSASSEYMLTVGTVPNDETFRRE